MSEAYSKFRTENLQNTILLILGLKFIIGTFYGNESLKASLYKLCVIFVFPKTHSIWPQ